MQTLPNIPELQTYPLKQILSVLKYTCEFFKRTDFEIPDVVQQKLFLSAIVSANKSNGDRFKENQIPWEELFAREVNWACLNKKTLEEALDYISNKVFTPDVGRQFPELDKKEVIEEDPRKSDRQDAPGREIRQRTIVKPSLKKIKRGLKWRVEKHWDRLTPCAKAVFTVLCLRSTWPKREDAFPWAYGGVGKWSKGKGWEPGSLCKITCYSIRQVQRALLQLQGYGMIKKIFRAYEGMGASKFYVFFTPEMSRAFTALAKNKKRIPRVKKLMPRIN